MNQHPPNELFLQIGITSRCNLSCTHCYVDAPPKEIKIDLFTEAVRQFGKLKDLLRTRRAWVQLSGGEPLLHPELPAILELSSSAFPTKFLTNGTTVTPDLARMLARTCESVQVSFDGTRDVHDARRGEGSFDAALSGLRMLREAGVTISARATVGSDNIQCIEPLFRLLEPMIDAFHVSRVVPIGACETLSPETSDYRNTIYRLYSLRMSNPKAGLRDPFFGPLIEVDHEDTAFRGCGAGLSGLCVTETGDIYPCRRLPLKLGNIADISLAGLYFDHPLLRSLRTRELTGKCGNCEHKRVCGGSRCVAYAATGDPLTEDPGCIFA